MQPNKDNNNATRLAVLETIVSEMRESFKRIDLQFFEINKKIDKLDQDMREGFSKFGVEMKEGFSKIDSRFDQINGRLWTNFYWMLGTMVSGFAGGYAVFAKLLNLY